MKMLRVGLTAARFENAPEVPHGVLEEVAAARHEVARMIPQTGGLGLHGGRGAGHGVAGGLVGRAMFRLMRRVAVGHHLAARTAGQAGRESTAEGAERAARKGVTLCC